VVEHIVELVDLELVHNHFVVVDNLDQVQVGILDQEEVVDILYLELVDNLEQQLVELLVDLSYLRILKILIFLNQ